MSKLTVIRHCATRSNEEGLYIGELNIRCSAKGLQAAREMKIELEKYSFSRYYTSPLIRSIETSRILFSRMTVIVHPALKERSFGLWEGKRRDEIRVQFPDLFLPSGTFNPQLCPPGGEPFNVFIERVWSFIRLTKRLKENEHVAAVTHSGVIRVMKYLLAGRNLNDLRFNAPFLKPITFDLSSRGFSEQVKAVIE